MSGSHELSPKNSERKYEVNEKDEKYEELTTPVQYESITKCGLFYHFFLQAVYRQFFVATLYPFFKGFLNLTGHQYQSIKGVADAFWCWKFLFGILSDAVPIFRKKRVPYIIMGWMLSVAMLAGSACLPYPQSYYRIEDCNRTTEILNSNTIVEGRNYGILLGIGKFGIAITDVAADGLMVEYTKREVLSKRGTANAISHFVQAIGRIVTPIVIAITMSGPEYGGKFCNFSVRFDVMSAFYCLLGIPAIINAIFFIVDDQKHKSVNYGIMYRKLRHTAMSPSFIKFGIFIFLDVMSSFIASSASPNIKRYWAEVTPFVDNINQIIMGFLWAVGIWVVKTKFLNTNWRHLILVTRVFIFFISAAVEFTITFDIVRSQYLYFADEVLTGIPMGMSFLVGMNVAAEISENGLEAVVFGVYMSLWSLGLPIAALLGNIASQPFQVSSEFRFARDSMEDRTQVAYALTVIYIIKLVGFLAIPLLPEQKTQLQKELKTEKPTPIGGILFLIAFLTMLVISTTMNLMTISPKYTCLEILGGDGCE